MPTWKSRFNELSTAQSNALNEAKRASSNAQWSAAISKVTTTVNDISSFLKKYESAGRPDHDAPMPSD